MPDFTISVVIPTYNRVSKLKRVLDSLVEDEYPFKDIIVCDGASTDGTVSLLQSYGSQVRWISKPDRGEYEARNRGLRMSKGGIIKYISDDDVLLPGSLSFGAQYFVDHPEVDILFGQSVWIDERGNREPMVCDTRVRTSESITLKNFIRSSSPSANSESAFFRREVIRKIGFFDETLIGADLDFWVRAAIANLNMTICDRIIVEYHLSEQSGVERRLLELLFERWRLANKYGDWIDRFYVGFYYIPKRLFLRVFIKLFPFISVPLRDAWGRWKSRHTLG